MEIESNRSQFSGPLSPMMRPKCAMEETATDQYETIKPSIPEESEGARVTRKLERNDSILDAAAFHQKEATKAKEDRDRASGIAYQLGEMLVAAGIARWPIKLDTFLVDMGKRVTDEKVGNFYEVRPVRPGKAGS
jgi:hypothetical protein